MRLWTDDDDARELLDNCAARPPRARRVVTFYPMTRDEWIGYDDDRITRLEQVRAEWIARSVGFSWQAPDRHEPAWGTPQWTAMRDAYYTLSDLQPDIAAALAIHMTKKELSCKALTCPA